jgi:hypothetical protein
VSVHPIIRGIVRPVVRGIIRTSDAGRVWDTDALARISQIETAKGSPMTNGQRLALDTFIKAEKAAGRWSLHKRVYLPVWGNAAANSICLVSGTTGTMVNTPTQGAGFMQCNGSSSYFNTGSSPSALGATNASASIWLLQIAPDTRNDGRWSGWRGGGSERFALGFSGFPSVNFAIGGASTGGNFPANDSRTGIFLASNETISSRFVTRRTNSGAALIGSQSTTETTPLLNLNIFFGAWNHNNSGPGTFSDARFGGFGFGLGMSQANANAFTLNLKNLYEGCTGSSISAAPSFTAAPVVTGSTDAGATLTRTTGSTAWGETLGGQWYKNGVATGSTGATYSATSGGDQVFWRSTATNVDGTTTADSNIMTVSAAADTHANLPPLGKSSVKPVCWSNDETSDAYSEQLLWAMHILGLINLVWQDQVSSTDANIANQNSSGHNPTLTASYYSGEITARANDFIHAGNSGWDTSGIPAIAGTYQGHIVHTDNVADAVRRSSPPASTASLVAAIEAHYTPTQPVLFICGGPLTTLADAYLSKPTGEREAFAAKVTVVFVAGGPGDSNGWYNEWADSMAARIVFKHFTCVNLPTTSPKITGVTVATGQTSMTCDATTLVAGQALFDSNYLPKGTYIVSTNGTNSATLSAAATGPGLSGAAVSINRSFPMVPKEWLTARLPDSALRSRMFAKTRTGNPLPNSIDGDAIALVLLIDPAYVTSVTRYAVGESGEQCADRTQYSGTPSYKTPVVSANPTGKLYYCTGLDFIKATGAWWSIMTTPRLWTKNADLTFSPIASNGGTDSFAVNGSLGANWAQLGTITQGTVVSNSYAKSTTGYAYAAPVATYTNDHYAQFKVTQAPAANYYASFGVRNAFHSGSDVNGYQLYSAPAGTTLQTGTAGVYTNPHSGLSAFVAGDTWRVAIKGTLLTVWRSNGAESSSHVVKDGFKLVAVSANRTEHTTGKPSLLCSRNAGPTEFGDDWVSGNVT